MSTPRTLRRVAVLRELAALGLHNSRVARLLGVTPASTTVYAKRFGIVFQRKPRWQSPASVIIRRGYENDLPPSQIAAELGCSVKSVMVRACMMGLTAPEQRRYDPGRFKRGYRIPDELWPQYQELRRLGLTFDECAYNLGLKERPRKAA